MFTPPTGRRGKRKRCILDYIYAIYIIGFILVRGFIEPMFTWVCFSAEVWHFLSI